MKISATEVFKVKRTKKPKEIYIKSKLGNKHKTRITEWAALVALTP